MDMFDFFFPEQAQAMHLRRIAGNQSRSLSTPNFRSESADETESLRADVNFLSLVIAAILKRLAETQTMSMDDVKDLVDEIDGLDGIGDGGLQPGVLRGLLGVLRQDIEQQQDTSTDEFKIDTSRHRYRR